MRVITDVVQAYRSALQTLWNSYYWRDREFRDSSSVRDFAKIQPHLFHALVTKRLELTTFDGEKSLFGESFLVTPLAELGKIPTISVNMQTSDAFDRSWELLADGFGPDDLRATVVDFFDWNLYSWRDFRYFRVKISHFPRHPELVGK